MDCPPKKMAVVDRWPLVEVRSITNIEIKSTKEFWNKSHSFQAQACLKTFVAPFFPTQLTDSGSPRKTDSVKSQFLQKRPAGLILRIKLDLLNFSWKHILYLK